MRFSSENPLPQPATAMRQMPPRLFNVRGYDRSVYKTPSPTPKAMPGGAGHLETSTLEDSPSWETNHAIKASSTSSDSLSMTFAHLHWRGDPAAHPNLTFERARFKRLQAVPPAHTHTCLNFHLRDRL
ncbi:hypothetical protein HispidOSU_012138 [Sigmodon hispidus]